MRDRKKCGEGTANENITGSVKHDAAGLVLLLYELSLLFTDVVSPYWSDGVQAEVCGLENLCGVFVHFLYPLQGSRKKETCLVFLKSKEATC